MHCTTVTLWAWCIQVSPLQTKPPVYTGAALKSHYFNAISKPHISAIGSPEFTAACDFIQHKSLCNSQWNQQKVVSVPLPTIGCDLSCDLDLSNRITYRTSVNVGLRVTFHQSQARLQRLSLLLELLGNNSILTNDTFIQSGPYGLSSNMKYLVQ